MDQIKWFILFLIALNLMVVPSTIYAVYYGDVPTNQLPIEVQIISTVTLSVGSICVLIIIAAATINARYGTD